MDILTASGEAPRQTWLEQASTVLKRTLRVSAVSAALAGIAYLALQPNAYEASADIQLPTGTAREAEIAHILSPPMLAQIITRLSSDQVAALRETAADPTDIATLLQRSIQLHTADGAGIVRVVAVAAKPANALSLAAAVVDTYLADANVPISPVDTAAEQRLTPDRGFLSTPLDGRQQALYGRMATALEARITLESRADLADTLLAQENFYALAREFDTAADLASRVEQLSVLQNERDVLAVTLLPNHPTMRTINERIIALTSQLHSDGANVAAAARSAIAAARQTEAVLRSEFDALSTVSETTSADNIDRATLTGAISTLPRQLALATAEPRPRLVSAELGSALVGGLAFLGQIGLLAMARPQARRKTASDSIDDEMAFSNSELDGVAPREEAKDWFDLPPLATMATVQPQLQPAPAFSIEPEPLAAPETSAQPMVTLPDPPQEQPVPVPTEMSPRIVVVSSSTSTLQAQLIADDLLETLGRRGQRVAIVDAGSRRRCATAGISDLAAGRVSVADVIQFDTENDVATVSWGRLRTADLGADTVKILLLALSELYDAVIVVAGKISADSTQPLLSMQGILAVDVDAMRPR